jgi:lipoyl-dependent peroxiredoxin subunit D
MSIIEALAAEMCEPARDIKLNLQAVLAPGSSLTPAQRWGVAIAAAVASRNVRLQVALIADARAEVPAGVVEDAVAAAALMGMNNVYYRFRHLIGKASYGDRPARLRMNRLVKPAGPKVDFELYCLAASAVGGCESCMRSHERVVIAGGITEEQVHDAVRITATIHAAAIALEVA